jgi:hypothetical protein
MKTGLRIAAIVLALAATAASAQVYKWVDEKGRTQYGERPPDNVKATPINVPPPPSGSEAPQPDWKQKDLDFQRRKIERDKNEAQDESAKKRQAASRESACSDAHRRLSTLQEQLPVYQRNDKGERIYIEDKERERMMADYRRFISENCR